MNPSLLITYYYELNSNLGHFFTICRTNEITDATFIGSQVYHKCMVDIHLLQSFPQQGFQTGRSHEYQRDIVILFSPNRKEKKTPLLTCLQPFKKKFVV